MTLGGDDAPSIPVPDPTASSSGRSSSSRTEVQVRVLHLWTDGFSIEDGPLHRFDDPQNAADLAVIRSGRAPIHLMNVQPDQPVDVHINKHDENYRPPPKVYKPFGGSGHRLGSPTPGDGSPSRSAAAVTTPAAAQTTAAAESTPDVDLDPEQPILTIRLQLANGTRLPARFNASHTIGDVYGFVERAFPGSSDRAWVLATTFPNKDHTDRALALGEVPEFRKGGTAVMKWV
jgi:UBX domain-containing protein 1